MRAHTHTHTHTQNTPQDKYIYKREPSLVSNYFLEDTFSYNGYTYYPVFEKKILLLCVFIVLPQKFFSVSVRFRQTILWTWVWAIFACVSGTCLCLCACACIHTIEWLEIEALDTMGVSEKSTSPGINTFFATKPYAKCISGWKREQQRGRGGEGGRDKGRGVCMRASASTRVCRILSLGRHQRTSPPGP